MEDVVHKEKYNFFMMGVLPFIIAVLLPLNLKGEWFGFLFQSIFILLIVTYVQLKRFYIFQFQYFCFFSIWTVFASIFILDKVIFIEVLKNIFLLYSVFVLVRKYKFNGREKLIRNIEAEKVFFILMMIVLSGFVLRIFFPGFMSLLYPGKSYVTSTISRNSSFFSNPNYAGFSLCVFSTLIFSLRRNDFIKILFIVFLFLGILLTGSRSSLFCFIWIFFLKTILSGKFKTSIVVFVMIIALFLNFQISNSILFKRTFDLEKVLEIGGRDVIYHSGYQYLDCSLLSYFFGYGLCPIKISDSLFLDLGLRFGIIGLFLFSVSVVILHYRTKTLMYLLSFIPMYFTVEIFNSPTLILIYFTGFVFFQVFNFSKVNENKNNLKTPVWK